MKVRWNANGLRLRITPSELAVILEGKYVLELLLLPGGAHWQASIQPGEETRLASEGQNAIVFLSSADRQRLALPEAEGIYFQTENSIRYFVEKDFPCVHPRALEMLETPTETFDAPDNFERRKQEMKLNGE